MNSSIFLLICIVLINLNVVVGQNEVLECIYNYRQVNVCALQIYNPRGLNNFYTIGGSTDYYNTTTIINKYSSKHWNSTIVPTIICDKFINLERMEFAGLGIKNIIIFGFEDPFEKCNKLTYLDLCDNKITGEDEMPFSTNRYLEELRLCNNELASLSEFFFSNLTNLKILWLNGNKLVDFRGFESPMSLTTLNLAQNQIKYISENAFSSLQKLNTLILGNNSLEVIYSNSFKNTPSLKNIEFNNNKIYAIERYFVSNITGVVSLNMIGNNCSNEYIFDNSTGRFSMKIVLAPCFENFEQYVTESTTIPTTTTITSTSTPTTTYPGTPPKCSDENIDERVCGIEDEIDVLKDAIERLENKVNELSNRPCACS